MKQFFLLLSITALFAACGGPEGVEVESSAAEAEAGTTEMVAAVQYNVDPSASIVNWEGTKLIGGGHTGTIPVANGQIMTAGGKIVGGKFTMDIREITNTDMPADQGGDKLVGHLKSADFFDVEKHPMANFTITKVQEATNEDGRTHEITGNLTLKGQSRSITIPATVSMDGDQIKASTPKFTIDRKEWGMEYGSDGIEGLTKDKVINNDVGLELMLVANK